DATLAAGRGAEEATRQEALSERDPLNPVPHVVRGLILDRLGLLDAAIDALEAAVALSPGLREPRRMLAGVLSRTVRAAAAQAAIALDPGALLSWRALANTLPYQDGVTGAALLRAARGCSDALPRGALSVLHKSGDPNRTLTVGLLSGTLRTHPVGWLTVAG